MWYERALVDLHAHGLSPVYSVVQHSRVLSGALMIFFPSPSLFTYLFFSLIYPSGAATTPAIVYTGRDVQVP